MPLLFKRLLPAALLCGFSLSAHAFDSASLEFANGNKTQIVRLGVQSDWNVQWWRFFGWHFGGYWDFNLSQWRGTRFNNEPDRTQNITSIGVTPVLRWQPDSGVGPYVEAGIGAHYLSTKYNNNGHQLSTNFEFGSHVGLGYLFANRLDLGVSYRHFSNAGIKEPNSGVNFFGVRAGYRF